MFHKDYILKMILVTKHGFSKNLSHSSVFCYDILQGNATTVRYEITSRDFLILFTFTFKLFNTNHFPFSLSLLTRQIFFLQTNLSHCSDSVLVAAQTISNPGLNPEAKVEGAMTENLSFSNKDFSLFG